MKIGVSTLYGLISKSVIETVEELEKAGFDTLELMYEYNHLLTDKEIKILKSKKLDFSMHCPFIGVMFTHLNYNFSAPQIELVKKSLEAALEIGCSHYIIHGGNIPMSYLTLESPKPRDFFVDLLRDLKTCLKNIPKPG
jgi:sugar phosphate isomerase/epimerase